MILNFYCQFADLEEIVYYVFEIYKYIKRVIFNFWQDSVT